MLCHPHYWVLHLGHLQYASLIDLLKCGSLLKSPEANAAFFVCISFWLPLAFMLWFLGTKASTEFNNSIITFFSLVVLALIVSFFCFWYDGPFFFVSQENGSSEEHMLYVWDHFVSEAAAKNVFIIAHSYGGLSFVELVSLFSANTSYLPPTKTLV